MNHLDRSRLFALLGALEEDLRSLIDTYLLATHYEEQILGSAYEKAAEKDRSLLLGPLSGELTREKIQALYSTFVDPENPDQYRWTWCGRFSVPFGLLLLDQLARSAGTAVGHPIAYATSVGAPELPLRELGLGSTAPANLYHFVGYPAAAFTIEPGRSGAKR